MKNYIDNVSSIFEILPSICVLSNSTHLAPIKKARNKRTKLSTLIFLLISDPDIKILNLEYCEKLIFEQKIGLNLCRPCGSYLQSENKKVDVKDSM